MNKQISLGLAISIAALAAAVTFIVTSFFSLRSFNEKVQAVKEKAEKYERLEVIDSYVRSNYYTELDEESLVNGMLKGYMSGLNDPYSNYMTPEEYQSLQEKESGRTVGIGVTVTMNEEGYIHIIEVQKGSPAEKAGLLKDDLVVAVNEQDVLEIGFDEAVTQVKGEEGTRAVLTIRREGKADRIYRITRETFDLITVDSKLLSGEIGYISISAFRENTPQQFHEAMETLTANGAKALIFDVRNNGGGLLNSLEEIVDPLLPEGEIATATYQDGTTETALYSDAQETDIPMAVLINGNSASAAELFAASLRDFKDAQLVGATSFGKGIMQVTTALEDGGGLTLTVATYQTTRSDCYHGVGLEPDVPVEAAPETEITAIDPDTDPQLAKAIEVLR
ncbi:MAG: S41 family peptidase [Oscillospiraceae bacterium]|nr:S41 family peptidase [Oscillospiraceae bacterium]MBQ9109853.1 S41 family peptidase [Oscillospiraceae bacterium]